MPATACFVTRNHQANLARALESVQPVAAEIIVLDTGSTDDTIAIAQAHGAKVVPYSWTRDFSAASNAVVEAATQEWILWMNPDESLNPRGHDAVHLAMTRPHVLAYELRVQQELNEKLPGFGTANWQARLYRRIPAIRYHGRIHPKFVTPLAQLAAQMQMEVKPLEVTIHRYAYLSVPTPDKIRWSNQLLEAELADRPGQLDLQIELGRNKLLLNDPSGHQMLAEVAELVRQCFQYNVKPPAAIGSLMEYLFTVSPEQNRCPIPRAELLEWANRWCHNVPPVLWALATERFAAKDYPRAAYALNRLLELGQTQQYDTHDGFDPDIIGRAALLNLSVCQIQLLQWDQAQKSLQKLLPDAQYRERATALLKRIEDEKAKIKA